jgi:hypothetical protein
MTISMYKASAPIFVQFLTSLSAALDKAAAHAEAKKIDPAVLLNARLYPDMFPLVRQVRQATSHAANACGRLAGAELLTFTNTEASIPPVQGGQALAAHSRPISAASFAMKSARSEHNSRFEPKFARLLIPAHCVLAQERGQRGSKIYSLHAREVECIGNGKPHKPYEFGSRSARGPAATNRARSAVSMRRICSLNRVEGWSRTEQDINVVPHRDPRPPRLGQFNGF